MSLEQEAGEGIRASRLKEDLDRYFVMVRTAIIDKWEQSPIADREGQHELRLMLKLLGDLERNIQSVIDTGKMAEIQIQRDSLLDKVKNTLGI